MGGGGRGGAVGLPLSGSPGSSIDGIPGGLPGVPAPRVAQLWLAASGPLRGPDGGRPGCSLLSRRLRELLGEPRPPPP